MRIIERLICCSTMLLAPLLGACGPDGTEGSSEVADLPIKGTIFTIVLENHGADVVEDDMPFTQSLANAYASTDAYYSDHHPSLPNYIIMTSGKDHGVEDDDPPSSHPLEGTDHLAEQLDAAGVKWR